MIRPIINASLPRGDDPTDLTMDGALALLASAAKRKKTGKKKVAKKKTKKKTTKKKVAKKTTRKKTTKKKAT